MPRSFEKILGRYDLRRDALKLEVLRETLALFKSREVTVHEIMAFDIFFRIVVADNTDLAALSG